MQLNEVMIVTHPGDNLNDIIDLAICCANIKGCQYAVFRFNDVKIFATKGKNKEQIQKEYHEKLK